MGHKKGQCSDAKQKEKTQETPFIFTATTNKNNHSMQSNANKQQDDADAEITARNDDACPPTDGEEINQRRDHHLSLPEGTDTTDQGYGPWMIVTRKKMAKKQQQQYANMAKKENVTRKENGEKTMVSTITSQGLPSNPTCSGGSTACFTTAGLSLSHRTPKQHSSCFTNQPSSGELARKNGGSQTRTTLTKEVADCGNGDADRARHLDSPLSTHHTSCTSMGLFNY